VVRASIEATLGALGLMLAVLAPPVQAADSALNADANKNFLANNAKKAGVVVMPGIQYRVLKSGSGTQPGRHDCVTVNYTGSLINGKVFDATKGSPATFQVNGVVSGWTEVLQLMHEGDDWEVVIPPGLAYGKSGAGGVIPADQTLVFEIELLKVFSPSMGGCG
jgi:FKBP-type peptidyl-prolyl cis-trans isomerase FklB